MKIPVIERNRTAFLLSILFMILLEIALYFNVVWYVQIFNILLMLPFYGLFLAIFRRFKPTMVCMSVLMLTLSIANEFSVKARSVAFQVSDFFCLPDAIRLSGRYRFILTPGMVRAVLCTLVLLGGFLFLLRHYEEKSRHREKLFAGLSAIVVALPIVMFTGIENHHDGDIKFDINTFTKENGVLYSLFVEVKQHGVDQPEGYSAETAKETLKPGQLEEGHNPPNIIVIMNESLADYDEVGTLPLTQDVLPFIHSMEENCMKGNALVSVFGGYTCNSEWEFLTGNSMAFLPVTVVPYNQFIENKTDSLAHSLKTFGYQTTAIHPYHGIEWNRDENYPHMGFDTFLTSEDFGEVTEEMLETLPDSMDESLYFGDLEYIRGFVSDAENYRKIIEVMEEKEAGTPQFIFNVTIQNHGSYHYDEDDFETIEFCEGATDEVNQYLTVANLSDQAFAGLIEYFSSYEEDTIILMFGDHQPALDMPYTSLHADSKNSVAVREGNYTVPYVMWANYDVDWEAPDITSLNYLSVLLKQNAGLPMDSWDTFRMSAMDIYPALNSYGAVDANGHYLPLETALNTPIMQEYNMLQYYRIFDAAEQSTETDTTETE